MDKRKDAILGFLKARGQASLADVATHLEVSKQGALRHPETPRHDGLGAKGRRLSNDDPSTLRADDAGTSPVTKGARNRFAGCANQLSQLPVRVGRTEDGPVGPTSSVDADAARGVPTPRRPRPAATSPGAFRLCRRSLARASSSACSIARP